MAYLLRFPGVTQYVALSSMAGGAFADRNDTNQNWSLEFEFARSGANTYVHRLFSSTIRNDEILFRASDGLFRLQGLAGSASWSGVTISTIRSVYRIERIVGTTNYELFVDTVSQGIQSASVTIFNFDIVGKKGSGGYVNGDLYYVDYSTSNSGVSLYLDPSATSGTGTTLEDTAGTNDGTLTDFTGTTNSWWVSYGSSALALTPLAINSSSVSIDPVIQYSAIVNLLPSTINSSSIALNPAIQYSAAINITPSVINTASVSLDPSIQYSSIVNLTPDAINSSSISLDPSLIYSSTLLITPNVINSSSVALSPTISYSSTLNILPAVINSESVSLNPAIQYSSILNIAPSVINSNSESLNPAIIYTSALIILPQTINSASSSINPIVEYKAVINLTPNTINSLSVSINPFISTGQTQTVGNVTAGFANDLYSVKYKLSGITVNFKG
jgi:hypothetical protein